MYAIKFVKYAIIFVAMMIVLFPLFWMVNGSLQNLGGLHRLPPHVIPAKPTLNNYTSLLLQGPPGVMKVKLEHIIYPLNWAKNTLVILIIKLAIVIVTVTTAAYAFAIYEFKFKNTLFLIYIAGMVMPPVMLIPTFVVVKKLGLYNSMWAMILTNMYNAAFMYLMRNYIASIPKELIDSARIEGAGEMRIMWRMILPMCKPPLGVGILIITMDTLKDYIWGLMVLPDTPKWTFMVGVMYAVRNVESAPGGNYIGVTLAAGVVTFIPLFLVFVFCQKYFISGIRIGGVKA